MMVQMLQPAQLFNKQDWQKIKTINCVENFVRWLLICMTQLNTTTMT